jgi:hypothetical protein
LPGVSRGQRAGGKRHSRICDIVPPWCPAMMRNGSRSAGTSTFQRRMLSCEALHGSQFTPTLAIRRRTTPGAARWASPRRS